MAAGEFKAKCLQVLDDVHETHKEVTITKRGKPLARLVPIESKDEPSIFGRLKGTGTILGDIIGPLDEKWDADA